VKGTSVPSDRETTISVSLGTNAELPVGEEQKGAAVLP